MVDKLLAKPLRYEFHVATYQAITDSYENLDSSQKTARANAKTVPI